MRLDMSRFKKVYDDDDKAILQHEKGHQIMIAKQKLSKENRCALDDLPMHMADGGMTQQPEDLYRYGATFSDPETPSDPNVPQGTPQPRSSQAGLTEGDVEPPSQEQDPYGFAAYLQNLNQGIGQQIQGIQGEAAAKGRGAQEKVRAYDDLLKSQKGQIPGQLPYKMHQTDAQGNPQEVDPHQWLMDQANRLAYDIDHSHIDPHHYQDSMNTGGKIQTIVGLILGGAGSYANGGRNPALEYYNKMIENDLNTQKANLDKKQTLLGSIMKFLPDLDDASKFFQATKMAQLANKLDRADANATTDIEREKARQAKGLLTTNSAGLLSQINMLNKQTGKQGLISDEVFSNMLPSLYANDKEGLTEARKQHTEAIKDASLRDYGLDIYDQIAALKTVPNAFNPQTHAKLKAALEPLAFHLAKLMFGRTTESEQKAVKDYFARITNTQKTNNINREVFKKALELNMHYPLIQSKGYRIRKAPLPRRLP